MNINEQKKAAKKFTERWTGRGDEKSDTTIFWIELLSSVFGIDSPTKILVFEKRVKIGDSTKFIDVYLPKTKVLVEQKSYGIDLTKRAGQSDDEKLTPFEQGKRYSDWLPDSERARWIISCNFEEFHIHDMEAPNDDPTIITLSELADSPDSLNILIDDGTKRIQREKEVSFKAGQLVGKLYDALSKSYEDPESQTTRHALNVLCVRLVFCLYAEDSGVFGKHNLFFEYMKQFETRKMRRALIELFDVLNTPEDKRDPYLETEDPILASFPYVNGSLFGGEEIEIPNITEEIRETLLVRASWEFDWSQINPTIFGAVFESTLNPETRRSGGMHYTSPENIHKVIDLLFLDELEDELNKALSFKTFDTKKKHLLAFQEKLSSLKFLERITTKLIRLTGVFNLGVSRGVSGCRIA